MFLNPMFKHWYQADLEAHPRGFGQQLFVNNLLCDSVKDNSDLFLSIYIAATATHSLIVKEE